MPASAHQEQGGTVIFWVLPAGRLMGHALTLHRVLTENKGTGSLKNRPKTPSHQPKQGLSQELSLSTTKARTLYYHYHLA